ncbi:MAG: cyclopropane fatty acyl phospholipid synthase, partial [Alphaproteobacteria bacterium]|nr:cyclopropane fatty acyl phospholipid synthase [Alphaproteobacteria bacterium]
MALLEKADIRVGGERDWDVTVHDDRLYGRILTQGTLGLGEAYMDGWWDAPAIDQFIHQLLVHKVKDAIRVDFALASAYLRALTVNLQRRHTYEVAHTHYDLSDDLYAAMLDKRMIYSCGYWKNAGGLEEAQAAKLDLVCAKIGLEKGMRVLDIGSGWGGFLKYAAENYGIVGTGVTISKRQHAFSVKDAGDLELTYRLADYMALEGTFDRIVSIGMFEHVGYKNYAAFMGKVASLLAPDGLFLLHTIGGDISVNHGDPWAQKYIFPNGMLPSMRQISTASEKVFVMEDWHNFGADYDPTLMAWHENFEAAWPDLANGFDQRFYRMWRYYLLS